MNVEIRSEAAQFPEKEYTNEIFVAVHLTPKLFKSLHPFSAVHTPTPPGMYRRRSHLLQ